MGSRVRFALFVSIVMFFLSAVGFAQNIKPPAATPATPMVDSHPDLSGVWTNAPTGRPVDPSLFGVGRKETIPPDQDQTDLFGFRHSPLPMQPWAKEKFEYNRDPVNPYYAGRTALNPFLQCLPAGPTLIWLRNMPFEIIQTPKRILFIFESNHEIRQVWTDGREHPKDFGHTWMGHSIGRWEGNTLVVDTVGLNDLTWLDYAGHVHSDQLHVIEKFTRVGDRMTLEFTFDDPKAFTETWTARAYFQVKPKWELEEQISCEDRFLGKDVPLR